MITMKISCEGKPDQFVELDQGDYSVGSSLDHKVVLLDESVAGNHFNLKVKSEGVFVEMLDESIGVLRGLLKKNVVTASRGDVLWPPKTKLKIGMFTLCASGQEVRRKPPVALARAADYMWRTAKASMVIGVSVATVLIVGELLLQAVLPASQNQAAASVNRSLNLSGFLSSDWSSDNQDEGNQQNAMVIRADLEEHDFSASDVYYNGANWEVIVHLTDVAEKIRYENAVESLGYTISTTIFLDQQITRGIAIVLSNTPGNASISEVERGIANLTLPRKEVELIPNIREVLLTDVRGLREVRFTSQEDSVELDSIRSKIVAIWAGERPYMILADGKHVLPGEVVLQDTTLVEIEGPTSIILEISGKQERLELQ